ncbi:5-oxoprolinase subunit PxpB [Metabacillus lacus]|uniref:5-oxoprolinase subunit PxpB n=1 Tax=Metabacillus lacus TaxID=1983721 RepID=UPI0024837131|nr:5-oxoprolinase subunit PxpB [Metabacillus lacus]
MNFSLHPLGDQAVMIQLGEEISPAIQREVSLIASLLDENTEDWMIEYVPAFTTLTLYYDPFKVMQAPWNSYPLPYPAVCSRLNTLLDHAHQDSGMAQRTVTIPVCYGGELGPDLQFVADHNGLTAEDVIRIHSTGDYDVHMIGFAPGFPYIGGMPETIAAPRRKSPRLKIPPRSVGIAGKQTGVYPIETPGGWQLIGRTPLNLFLPNEDPPTLLRAGDKIQFKSISLQEYIALGGDAE